MVTDNINLRLHTASFRREVKGRSDTLMNYFLTVYFLLGMVFATFYDTWLVAFGVGGLCMTAYYSVKKLLPNSNLYQYVLSGVLAIFMAQYIYQMHGLFEMHFTAFIGSAILITYQKWKLQLPMLLLVVIHHAVFGYLQNSGVENVYFTQLDTLELQTFIIHITLAGIIFFVCALWAYQLKKYSERQIIQTVEMTKLQKEAQVLRERKLNEEALEKSNKQLTKSNKELDKFVYSVSHDLRAPLTSMLGLIEITEDEVNDEYVSNNMGMLKASIHKLDGFILDILNYSRNARQEITMEEINFKELLEDIMTNLRYMNRDKKMVEINVDVMNQNTFVSDKQRINIIMNNILSNAIKYHDPKSPKPYVNVKIDTTVAETLITVSDNGVGVKKELHDKIFDMFYRVSHNSDGSGLGLYIVKESIEKLNGTIEVESELGIGTAFNIHLPNLQ